MMRLLKTPEEILAESYSYISVLTIFIGVMFAYNLCAGLLRAIGNSLMPLLFLMFSCRKVSPLRHQDCRMAQDIKDA